MALRHGTGPWDCETCGNELTKLEQEGEICFKCAHLVNELTLRSGNRLVEIRQAVPLVTVPMSEKGVGAQLSQPPATISSKEVIE